MNILIIVILLIALVAGVVICLDAFFGHTGRNRKINMP
jgi:hypothetical protein